MGLVLDSTGRGMASRLIGQTRSSDIPLSPLAALQRCRVGLFAAFFVGKKLHCNTARLQRGAPPTDNRLSLQTRPRPRQRTRKRAGEGSRQREGVRAEHLLLAYPVGPSSPWKKTGGNQRNRAIREVIESTRSSPILRDTWVIRLQAPPCVRHAEVRTSRSPPCACFSGRGLAGGVDRVIILPLFSLVAYQLQLACDLLHAVTSLPR